MDLHVVDAARVHLQGVGQHRRPTVGDVPHLHPVVHEGAHVHIVAPVRPLELPTMSPEWWEEMGPRPTCTSSESRDALGHLHVGGAHDALANHRVDDVASRVFGHEHTLRPVGVDLRPHPRHRPGGEQLRPGSARGKARRRPEAHHVAGAHGGDCRLERIGEPWIRLHGDLHRLLRLAGTDRDGRAPRGGARRPARARPRWPPPGAPEV